MPDFYIIFAKFFKLYLPIENFLKFDKGDFFLTLTWCSMSNTIVT